MGEFSTLARLERAESEFIVGEVVDEAPVAEAPLNTASQIALFFAPPVRTANGGEGVNVIERLLESKRSHNTMRNYQGDYRDFFCTFLDGHADSKGYPDPATVTDFLRRPRREIMIILHGYRASLLDRKLSEATAARRFAALKTLLKFAHNLEWCETDGRGLIENERIENYRDTKGIDPETTKKLLLLPAKLHGAGSVRALRDEAMIRILASNGLRCSSVCRADVGDFSLSECRLSIFLKGKGTQKKSVRLPTRTVAAVAAYLLAAGHKDDKGPLFRNLHHDPAIRGERLRENGLYKVLKTYEPHVGVELRAHLFRHGAITALAKATNGNLVEIQEFSGHAKTDTVRIYVKNAEDTQGRLADMLDDIIAGKKPKARRK